MSEQKSSLKNQKEQHSCFNCKNRKVFPKQMNYNNQVVVRMFEMHNQ